MTLQRYSHGFTEENPNQLMVLFCNRMCVFIVATIYHYDEISSKSEEVTWELFLKLVDLTWNDPARSST